VIFKINLPQPPRFLYYYIYNAFDAFFIFFIFFAIFQKEVKAFNTAL